MSEVHVLAPTDNDMECKNIKITFQNENPVTVTEEDKFLSITCLQSVPFKVSGLPSDYKGKVTYTSSNASVVTAADGMITGRRSGNGEVYALFGAYGDYGPKRVRIFVNVGRGQFFPTFENKVVYWLSTDKNMVNWPSNVPESFDGKVAYSFLYNDNNYFSVADPTTGRLAIAPISSGQYSCVVNVSFTESDSFEDASCQYDAIVYAADDEGFIKICNGNDFAYYRGQSFTQDKKLRLYDDIVVSDVNDRYNHWNLTFSGELDGAGHTITFKNNPSVTDAYFKKVENATIRNLKLSGSSSVDYQSGNAYASAFIGEAAGNTTLTNCSLVDRSTYLYSPVTQGFGALVGYVPAGSKLTIEDCLIQPSIVPVKAPSDCRYYAFVAQSDGETHISSCLCRGYMSTTDNFDAEAAGGNATIANSYISYMYDRNDTRLKSGEVAWLLQADRETTVWGQKLPSLDGTDQTADGTPQMTSDASKRVYRLSPAVAPDAAVAYANNAEPQLQTSVSAAGYATYYNSFACRLPQQLKAYTVNIGDDGKMALNEIADGVVPAMTAVLLKSTSGETVSAPFTMLPTDTRQPIAGSNNMLRGSDTATMTHARNGASGDSTDGGTASSDGTLYYKLAYGRSNTAEATHLGFWWGATHGAAFLSDAHKAWLALPQQTGAKPSNGFAIGSDGSATCINAVDADSDDKNTYTIGGIRMSGKPVRMGGIYVVNGKKVTIGK